MLFHQIIFSFDTKRGQNIRFQSYLKDAKAQKMNERVQLTSKL